jgi:hypothetical protein
MQPMMAVKSKLIRNLSIRMLHMIDDRPLTAPVTVDKIAVLAKFIVGSTCTRRYEVK